MKVKNVYLNYSEKTRSHYFTVYFVDGTKVYIPYEYFKVAENIYDKKLKNNNNSK